MKKKLTHRQMEIVRIAVWGRSAKNAAYLLGISEKTVTNTLLAVRDKIGVSSVHEITAWYLETIKGLTPPKGIKTTQAQILRGMKGFGVIIISLVMLQKSSLQEGIYRPINRRERQNASYQYRVRSRNEQSYENRELV